MFKRLVGVALLASIILTITGCSQPIRATQVTARVEGDTVLIPVGEVANAKNTRFTLKTVAGEVNFMAYTVEEDLYVRANVCPPCRSIGFSLKEKTLICDRCATTFNAETGAGIKGACVNFPKAGVPYTFKDGKIMMKVSDLATAYQNTLEPGLP